MAGTRFCLRWIFGDDCGKATSVSFRNRRPLRFNRHAETQELKERGARRRPCKSIARERDWEELGRVVHLKFDRMRGVFEANDLLHFEVDVGLDKIVVEDVALLQELAILVEICQSLAQ